MTSQNRRQGAYVYDDSTDAAGAEYEVAKRRNATVYDAVAGRVSLKFSKDAAATVGGSRKTSSGHHQVADPVLAPEEVLFSRTNAPQRYAEKDIYFAHEDLPSGSRGTLPDSDLVKAVHSYASHFYEAMGQRHDRDGRGSNTARVDEKSMDETALLSLGILLEEAARESLGRNGDLVFTEGIDEHDFLSGGDNVDGGDESASATSGRSSKGKQTAISPQPQSYTPVGFEDEPGFWKRKYSKRRKANNRQEE